MTLPLVIFLAISCLVAVVVPWMGVVIYYVMAVGQLTAFYPHHFGENRIFLFMTLATLAGLGIATAARQVDWRRLLHYPSLLMFLLVVVVNFSAGISPFQEFEDVKRGVLSPVELLETFNKIMLYYFVAVLLIDTRTKLVTIISVVGTVLLYYTFWANKVYLTNELWLFGDNGRLGGPVGVYHDENYLALLFLIATPILYYLAVGCRIRILRWALWLCIPLSWHGLFLTGSRGAFLSLGIVCCYIFFRSYSKKASLIFLVAFAVAVVDQSGQLLDRVTNTVDKAEYERDRAFIENSDDSPEIEIDVVDPRVISWTVGFDMIKDYPIMGVGTGNFMRAFPEYHNSEPHVAHNTFIQFAADNGLIAGFVYLFFLFTRLKNVFSKPNAEKEFARGLPRDYLDDLLNALLISFYCVAFFLDLMILEVTYFIFLVVACKYSLDRAKEAPSFSLIESIYRWRQDSIEREEGPQVVSSSVGHVPLSAQVSEAEKIVEEEPVEVPERAPSVYASHSNNQYAKHIPQ